MGGGAPTHRPPKKNSLKKKEKKEETHRVLSPYMLVVPRPGKIKKKIFTRSAVFFLEGVRGCARTPVRLF